MVLVPPARNCLLLLLQQHQLPLLTASRRPFQHSNRVPGMSCKGRRCFATRLTGDARATALTSLSKTAGEKEGQALFPWTLVRLFVHRSV